MTPKWYPTLCHPKMHPHIKFLDSYLKQCRRYATDTIILDMRSQVKVTVIQIWCVTHCHPKMHPYTKFCIPTSNYVEDMLRTRLFLKLGQRSRSQWPQNGTRHSIISRCIHTPNSGCLSQIILEILLGHESVTDGQTDGIEQTYSPPNMGLIIWTNLDEH